MEGQSFEGNEFDRGDLIRYCQKNGQRTYDGAAECVDDVLAGIKKALIEKGRIEIHEFGSFYLDQRAPREGRNAHGDWSVGPRKKVVFKAGKALSEYLTKALNEPIY